VQCAYHGGLFLDINERVNDDRVQGGEAVLG
jgi:hypothetical protein